MFKVKGVAALAHVGQWNRPSDGLAPVVCTVYLPWRRMASAYCLSCNFHSHLPSSLWVFVAKLVSSMQMMANPRNVLSTETNTKRFSVLTAAGNLQKPLVVMESTLCPRNWWLPGVIDWCPVLHEWDFSSPFHSDRRQPSATAHSKQQFWWVKLYYLYVT